MSSPNSYAQISGSIELPVCKSIINRFLVLKYLYHNLEDIIIDENMADDCILLYNILKENIPQYCNCKNAGTVFRFILAVSALENTQRIISGSNRMYQRSCKDLVDALRKLGAEIEYMEKDGYPPIKIISPVDKINYPKDIAINSKVSSQFISAIMMIAPMLTDGLTINLGRDNVSYSYIEMTSRTMNIIGLKNVIKNNFIYIQAVHENINFKDFPFERDWSSAAFWVTILSAYEKGEVIFEDLKIDSMQGDEKLLDYLPLLNIDYKVKDNSIILFKNAVKNNDQNEIININLKDQPDLFPALAVAFTINNIPIKINGLAHTRWKESDRLYVVIENLKLLNYNVEVISEDEILINKCDNHISNIKEKVFINSYNDHRIAMSFAIFEHLNNNIIITDKESARKSYPDFFNQLHKIQLSN
ncbi:hypothetical protein LJC69_00490 [Bacteroidales bacterium OttesenSCG-928-K22]|nr:hypothetical protein [Bacteroidales bacterium OttesenSCG-928-K22]